MYGFAREGLGLSPANYNDTILWCDQGALLLIVERVHSRVKLTLIDPSLG